MIRGPPISHRPEAPCPSTTLFRSSTGGEVLLDGVNSLARGGRGIRAIRGERVCYVAQSAAAAFNPAHRLGDQVVEAAVRHGKLTRAKALERARYLFGVLGLPDPANFGKRYPHQVSGGQLQPAMPALAPSPGPALIAFSHIGRASCRERVCHHGTI